MFIAQINFVAIRLLLIRSLSYKFEGFHRAGLDASLFAANTPFFIPIRSVKAEVAFGGFFNLMIPYRPVRLLGAHLEAGLTGNAFLLVNSSNIAILFVYIGRANRTIAHAWRINTLATGRNLKVVREFSERILNYLDA